MDHNGTDHVTWMLELFWRIHQGLDTSHFIGCFDVQTNEHNDRQT